MGYIDSLMQLEERLKLLSWTSEQLNDSVFLEPHIWEIYEALQMNMSDDRFSEISYFDNFLKKVTKKVHPLDTRIIDALFKRFPRSLLESTMLGGCKLTYSADIEWLSVYSYSFKIVDLPTQLLQEKYKKVIYLANGKLRIHKTPLSGGALVLNDRETLFWASDRLQLVTKSPSSADTTPVTKTIHFPINLLSLQRTLSVQIAYLPADEMLCFASMRTALWRIIYFDVNQLRQAEGGAQLSFKESIEINSMAFSRAVWNRKLVIINFTSSQNRLVIFEPKDGELNAIIELDKLPDFRQHFGFPKDSHLNLENKLFAVTKSGFCMLVLNGYGNKTQKRAMFGCLLPSNTQDDMSIICHKELDKQPISSVYMFSRRDTLYCCIPNIKLGNFTLFSFDGSKITTLVESGWIFGQRKFVKVASTDKYTFVSSQFDVIRRRVIQLWRRYKKNSVTGHSTCEILTRFVDLRF